MPALLDTPERRKARGAFFTPADLADHICRWAIRSPRDRVYEPSCGEAEFLLAAGHRLRQLGAPEIDQRLLHGAELHDASAQQALAHLAAAGMDADVTVGDFFDAVVVDEAFDAVVGNPPYVRYQAFTGDARVKAQQAALASGVRLSGLASSWAAFTVRAAQLLTPDGRLGLVLPAELLSTNYAGPVRRFLTERFADVRLIMFDERVFPGVLAEVVLLLAEGRGPTDTVAVYQARNLTDLDDPPVTHWRPTDPEAKWTPALLPPEAAATYTELLAHDVLTPLRTWGRTELGMVTGNNRWFCLSAATAAALRLPETDLLPISPPGSRHLRGLTFTDRAWRDLAADRPAYLFAPRHDLATPMSDAAAAYISDGEAKGIHTAYKCRVRTPWWQVPRVPVPDLLLTYMNHDAPRLVTNAAGVAYLNSVHGVTLRPEHRALGRDLLPLATLNSLTLLGAELVGRSYGGGILKLEPKEADVLPVPSPQVLDAAARGLRALRPQLSKHLRNADLPAAVHLVDRLLLVEHLGLRRADVGALRDAREALFARRTTRGSS